jgi:hypothetical protein
MKLKTLTITKLQEIQTNSVHVLNTTKGYEKGQVLFSVPKENGQGTDSVIVPNTFIPVTLTEQVSKKQLLGSSEFRSAVSRGVLVIVSDKDADEILATKAALSELNRIRKRQDSFRETVANLDEVHTNIDEGTTGLRDALGQLTVGEEQTLEDLVQPSILQLVVDLEELKDEEGAISTLRNIEKVTTKDYRYIYKTVNKKYKELISYAKTEHDLIKKSKKAKRR